MKKLILSAFLFFTIYAISQSEKSNIASRKHEIKFGGAKLLVVPALELTYEYIPSKDFSFGSSVLLNFSSNSSFNENFSVTPFGRFYFQESREYGAYGFFVEGFLKFATGTIITDYYNQKIDYQSGGYGLGIGKKWINNSGFVIETLVGGARGFGNGVTAPIGYFRGDINIGYRFN